MRKIDQKELHIILLHITLTYDSYDMNVYLRIHSLVRNDERTSPREGFYEAFAYLILLATKQKPNFSSKSTLMPYNFISGEVKKYQKMDRKSEKYKIFYMPSYSKKMII